MKNLAAQINKKANHVRRLDFLWALLFSFAIIAIAAANSILSIRAAIFIWVPFMGALVIRYIFTYGDSWMKPIQEVIDKRLSDQDAEQSNLLIAQKVAQSLQYPLFILRKDGIIITTNPAADEFVQRQEIEGKHIATVLRAASVFETADKIAQDQKARTVEFTTTGSVKRFCSAYIAPLDKQDPESHILIFVRDLTSELRIEQMRVDFIASASHELRTPLASLLGFIETLRGPAKNDPEAQKKFLKIMQKQAERMQRLVSDLMSLSRIELNEHIAPVDQIYMKETAMEVIDGLRPITEKSETNIDFDFLPDDQDDIKIIGDRDEIVQVIQNLIHNAIKYGGDPARIKLSLGYGEAPPLTNDDEPFQRAGDSAAQVSSRYGIKLEELVFLQVRDYGPGIERRDLPRLTERFYRVDYERNSKTGGTGLGLAIVKHILNRHKGGLQIESRLATGSAFNCYLPVAPDQLRP